jgi:Common central domain of tyrosinase/Polyphenol oxidase middle domain
MANYVRRDIWALEQGASSPPWDDYSLAYARAVREMQDRDPSDPTSWRFQAAVHGTYLQPPDPRWNGCEHGSWFFLPWHRIYIWYFEQIVRAVVVQQGGPADWSLPYWNYTDGLAGSSALPPAFRAAALPDGQPNRLHVPDGNRAAWANAGGDLPGPMTDTTLAMDEPSFSPGFGGLPKPPTHFGSPHGLLESQPHDPIHGAIGGNLTQVGCNEAFMTDPNCAALDPIFYLHHANIDRLWEKWIAQGGGRANPTQPEWTSQSFSFYDAGRLVRSKTCGDVAELQKLDYVYDDMPVPAPAADAPAPAEEAPVQAVAPAGAGSPPGELPKRPGDGPEVASGEGTELGSEPARVDLDVHEDAPSIAEAAYAAEQGPRLYLHLKDVETEATPGIAWEVRLGGGESDQPVGTISFFGRSHAHGEQAETPEVGLKGGRFIFDISAAVRRLQTAGRWDENRLTVSFHPVLPGGYSDQVPTVRVGRVYVTRG